MSASLPTPKAGPPCAPELHIGRRGTLSDTPVEVLGWTRWTTRGGEEWFEIVLRTEEGAWWLLEFYGGHWMIHEDFKHTPDYDPAVPPGATVSFDRERVAYPAETSTLRTVKGEYFKDLREGDTVEFRPFFGGTTVVTAQRELGGGRSAEWDWSRGAYIDGKDLGRAFDTQLPSGADGVPHPARPYPYSAWARALPWVLLAASLFSLIAMVAMPSTTAATKLSERIVMSGTEGEVYVGAFESTGPAAIAIRGDVAGLDNDWVYIRYVLATVPEGDSKEATALAAIASEYGAYYGYDSEGRWSESTTKSEEGIRIGAGSYGIVAQWERAPTAVGELSVHITVTTGYRSTMPLLIWFGLSTIIAIILFASRATHRRRVGIHWDLIEEYDP